MDKIILKGMAFYAYHGNLEEENILGQKFIVNVELIFNKIQLGIIDDVENTVDYSKVYGIIKNVILENTNKTIEYVGNNIANTILEKFELIDEIKVLLEKPQAPVAGIFDWMGIEIMRSRNDK